MNNIVTIIIPVYNSEKYLERLYVSLKNQTYSNLDIIFVNDASTDNSKSIINKLIADDKRFRIITHQSNKGVSAARNTGIRNILGDWILFIDSDDWVVEDYVEQLLNNALVYDSDIVMCGYSYAWDDGTIKEIESFGKINTYSSQKEKIALIPHASATRRLYKAIFYKKFAFDFPEEIRRLEEMAVTIPLLTSTEHISIINKPLYIYYQRKNSASNIKENYKELNFFEASLNLTCLRIRDGFEKEMEFRKISEMMYSKIFLLINNGAPNKYIKEFIKDFSSNNVGWILNPYIEEMPKLKKVFVKKAYKNRIFSLRLMIFGWGIIKRMR